jgi:hypothetical protein
VSGTAGQIIWYLKAAGASGWAGVFWKPGRMAGSNFSDVENFPKGQLP